jgi:alpha-tubulin suppressor-like RCC1 family protein
MQIGATAFGSLILDNNGKIWWFGSNGTIQN